MATQIQTKDKIKTTAQRALQKTRNGQTSMEKATEINAANRKAIEFLDSLDNATPEEIQEQKETWAFLKKALDEDRLSLNRPHFPDESEGL